MYLQFYNSNDQPITRRMEVIDFHVSIGSNFFNNWYPRGPMITEVSATMIFNEAVASDIQTLLHARGTLKYFNSETNIISSISQTMLVSYSVDTLDFRSEILIARTSWKGFNCVLSSHDGTNQPQVEEVDWIREGF